MPTNDGTDSLALGISGIWMKCFSPCMAIATTSGEPWIKMAMCWIYSCSVDEDGRQDLLPEAAQGLEGCPAGDGHRQAKER
jgi:hypothetical protein